MPPLGEVAGPPLPGFFVRSELKKLERTLSVGGGAVGLLAAPSSTCESIMGLTLITLETGGVGLLPLAAPSSTCQSIMV